MPQDETTLIDRARSGDAGAAAEIVERYQGKIYALCTRVLGDSEAAADITQETLIKVLTGLERFDGRSALGTWIHRIAANACYTRIRSDRVRRRAHAPWPEHGEPTEPRGVQHPGQVQEAEERGRLVSAALATLQPDHRVALVLRDVQGLEYDQIAEVLGVPTGTVKSRLFRARAAMREAIEHAELAQGRQGGA